MKEFNCLSKSQNISLPYFLEASAGTGKTFAIEHIVTRLVLEHNIPIQNILVVTFTKAATRELKARIRKRIEISERILLGKQSDLSLSYLNNLEEVTKKQFLERAQRSLCFFDEAEIYTIHGFCSKMLGEFFFEAGQSLISEESQYIQLLKDEIYHTLQTELQSQIFGFSQLEVYFKSTGKSLEDLGKRLLNLILKGATFPEVDSFGVVCDKIAQALVPIKDELLQNDLETDLQSLGTCYKGLLDKQKELKEDYVSQVRALKAISRGENCRDLVDKLLSYGSSFLEKLSEDNLKKSSKLDPRSVSSFKLFWQLKEKLLEILNQARDVTQIELQIGKICFERAQRALEILDMASPDDLLKQMQKALLQDSFLKSVRSKYKAALIDEFQDTDPIQWEIFSKLFRQQETFPVFLIGDPKQSIYGFRNADLKTYLQAKASFLDDQRFSLGTNYRSVAPVIQALNTLFSEKHAKGWLSYDKTLSHSDVKVGATEITYAYPDEKGSVHFGIFEGKKSLSSWPSKKLEESSIFPWVVREIIALKKQGIPLGSMAVLVKDRFQARRIENYLKSCQINCYSKNRAHIASTKAFSFIKALVKALDKPFDQSLTRLALAHPFIGLTQEDFIEASEVFINAQMQIKWLSKEMVEKGFERMWQSLTKFCFVDNLTFIDRICLSFEEAEFQDLLKIIELLLENKHPFDQSASHLICLLDEIESCSENEEDFVKRPVLGGDFSVKIMTTHMSKGLEFDIVFALGVASKTKRKEKILKFLTDQKAHLEAVDFDDQHHQNLLRDNNLEKARLFYVALTRAKKRVYIPAAFEIGEEPKELDMSALELFFSRFLDSFKKESLIHKLDELKTNNSISYELVGNLEKTIATDETSQRVYIENKPQRFNKVLSSLGVNSFSSLVKDHAIESVTLSQETVSSGSILTIPASKQTGVVLHSLLEKCIERGIYQSEEEKVESLVSSHLKLTHLEAFSSCITKALKRLFDSNLPLVEKPLRSFEQKDLVTETSFFFSDEKLGLIRGVIDLILVWKNKFFLIDWKTNFLGYDLSDYEQGALKNYMKLHKYDFQAALYAKSIQKYLKNFKELEFGGAIYVFLRALAFDDFPMIYLSPKELNSVVSYA